MKLRVGGCSSEGVAATWHFWRYFTTVFFLVWPKGYTTVGDHDVPSGCVKRLGKRSGYARQTSTRVVQGA